MFLLQACPYLVLFYEEGICYKRGEYVFITTMSHYMNSYYRMVPVLV